MSMKFATTLVVLSFFALTVYSQKSYNPLAEQVMVSAQVVDTDECVYIDLEEKVCFIDLEKVHTNLRSVALISSIGEVVIVRNVEAEPVNSIVEISLANVPRGEYLLEMRSYTQTRHKTIQLR